MKRFFLLLGCVLFLNACATATLPKGPNISQLPQRPDAMTVSVSVVDERASTKVGTIGAAIIHVKKDVEDLIASHLLFALNTEKNINGLRSYAENPASETGLKGTIISRIKELNMSSADAILQPVKVDLSLEISVNDPSGEKVFHTFAMGRYSKRIGITIVDKSTGQLTDSVVRDAISNLMQDPEFNKALTSLR